MPGKIEGLLTRELPRLAERGALPQEVVEPDAALPALPTAQARRQVNVHKVNVWQRAIPLDLTLDHTAIVGACNNPRLAQLSQQVSPPPPCSRFRSSTRLTGVCKSNYAHMVLITIPDEGGYAT